MGRVEAALTRLWWRDAPTPAAWALWPLSGLYGAVMALRRWAYALGWLRAERAPVPVIVVGNLVAGGAGKTPTVIALVQALRQAGWTPGVISAAMAGKATRPRPCPNSACQPRWETSRC